MIRIFLSTWSLDGNTIRNPVVDYVDSQPNLGITCMMYYPDADQDGLPDKSFVIVVMRSVTHDISGIANDLNSQPGVKLIPPGKLSTPLSSLTNPQRKYVRDLLTSYGIPLSAVDAATTVGELLRMVVRYASSGHNLPFESADDEFS